MQCLRLNFQACTPELWRACLDIWECTLVAWGEAARARPRSHRDLLYFTVWPLELTCATNCIIIWEGKLKFMIKNIIHSFGTSPETPLKKQQAKNGTCTGSSCNINISTPGIQCDKKVMTSLDRLLKLIDWDSQEFHFCSLHCQIS